LRCDDAKLFANWALKLLLSSSCTITLAFGKSCEFIENITSEIWPLRLVMNTPTAVCTSSFISQDWQCGKESFATSSIMPHGYFCLFPPTQIVVFLTFKFSDWFYNFKWSFTFNIWVNDFYLKIFKFFSYFDLVVLLDLRSNSLKDSTNYWQNMQLNRSLGY